MARRKRAIIALEALGRFSDYPIPDKQVKQAFRRAGELRGQTLESARGLFKRLLRRKNDSHVRYVREFFANVAARYPDAGFDDLGFAFFNTDSPNAIALHDPVDDSFAIGLDYGMISVFALTFPSLLHAKLRNLENLTWVGTLVDIVAFQIHNLDQGMTDYSPNRLREHRYLNDVASMALMMSINFVLAHELAHIHLGHFKTQPATRLNALGVEDADEEISTFDHQTEYDADAWAAATLRAIAGDGPIDQALASYLPSIYFRLFALAKSLYVPRTPVGRHIADSHPDVWDRGQRLLPATAPKSANPDPIAQAVCDLPCVIEAERNNPTFQFAAQWMRSRLQELG